ncbi:hypothetical protein IMSHALPRED_008531 [Imshaugia aleurites]|uniref:AB hydrolase-1 domain-containing protein n=1 Tax=Imshaugia aleurites TaxID=172621 RepID=A0A8H3ERD4_9LECA|nr:hypothetical protein IMSHALPRED_008531 [Imshaugia aleurites]
MATVASTESATAAQTPNMPTIVLVQGSFQIPKVYAKLVGGLVAKGYPTIHPELPTCSNTDSINFLQLSLVDDALAIRTELTRQVEYEGKTVVLVMHSYGGLVGSEATTEELSYTKRQAQGLPGGVTHLFYYSAFLLNEGQSVLSAWGESPNNDVKPDGRFYLLHGEEKLYSDLPPNEASLWASLLVAQSYRVQTTKLTRAAWRYIPSTYLICESDQAVPPQYQEMFAASAKAQVEQCRSGHSPHLSQPEMLVQKIHEACQKAVAEQI